MIKLILAFLDSHVAVAIVCLGIALASILASIDIAIDAGITTEIDALHPHDPTGQSSIVASSK